MTSRLRNVEIAAVGTWHASTGTHAVSHYHLAEAVAAQKCDAIQKPILKLGHTDPRFGGEPAIGWIENMRVVDRGRILVGDFVGMPHWLAKNLTTMYPKRSMEATGGTCDLGHQHGMIITAVALLGVRNPAISTLKDLQDRTKRRIPR